jgi:single-strand DNA-binding protein
MASFNKVILMGNLTRDPELRYTPSGMAIASFGIAINRRKRDQDGNQKDEVTFVDITAFDKQAELIGQYFQKGKGIHLEGRLKFDQWDDKNTGQKRSKLGVVLDRFEFIGGGQGDGGSPAPQQSAPTQSAPPPPSQPADGPPVDNPGDDDVPF